MASSRNDRIEILNLDIVQQNFCSFCTNFIISAVIGLNCKEVYCFAIFVL
jgi:hypothetical protein